jgi:hypothetical protein
MARPDGQRIGHGRLDSDSGYQIFGVWRLARFISSPVTPASGNMFPGIGGTADQAAQHLLPGSLTDPGRSG